MFRDRSAEVRFEGELHGSTREDVFRVVEQVAAEHHFHRVEPVGESALLVRHVQRAGLFSWWLLGWWTKFAEANDALVVNTRPVQGGTYVDVVGTGSSLFVDDLGDALDMLGAGELR